MGLYKRKDSKFFWMSKMVGCKRLTKSTETTNKKIAQRKYAQWTNELYERRHFRTKTRPNVSLGEVLDRYMIEASPQLETTTHQRNGQMIKNLKSVLGDLRIKDASPSEISKFKAERLAGGYSKGTIVRELGLLRRVFNVAVEEWELCDGNPVPKILKTLGKVDNKRVRYLSAEELQRLYQALPEWLEPIVTLARHTGLRRGNLLGLTWEQVDFDKGMIIIPRTKNGDPVSVYMSSAARETLLRCKKVQHLSSPYVFFDPDGRRLSGHRVSVAFKRAVVKAGVKDFRLHDLRHHFASVLVQEKVDILRVKELLCHKDLRMTMRYCHLDAENHREAISALDRREKCYDFATLGNKKGVA